MFDSYGGSNRRPLPFEPVTVHESRPASPETTTRVFAGGYIVGATPVLIPNTVVKPDKPMILLQRESRLLPA